MEPIVSPHDTAFIDGRGRTRATLVVVSGSARDYLARQEKALQESARLSPLAWWVTFSGIGIGLASVALVVWTLFTDLTATYAFLFEFIIIAVFVMPHILRIGIMPKKPQHPTADRAQRVNTLDDPARPFTFLVRNSQDAAVEFNPGNHGLFVYVLETVTPQRRARIRELAGAGEREVVRQAFVLLAQEYEPKHRREQEALRAQRMRAARAFLEDTPGAPQHPALPHD